MISKNQVSGLPEAIAELNRLSNIETDVVPNSDIDDIFDKNNEPEIEEDE